MTGGLLLTWVPRSRLRAAFSETDDYRGEPVSTSGGTGPGVADPAPAGQPSGHPDGAALRSRWERSGHLLAWVAAAAGLFACYLRVSSTVPVNSDGASNALQAWDMLHGNVLLHGWWLSDVSFYTTELPQYALLELAFGLHSSVVHVAGAMTYTLMVLLAAMLAKGKARGTAGTGRALIAAGIMLAPQLGGGASVMLLSPDHVGSTVPVLAAFLILDRGPRRWYVPVCVAALLAWSLVADRVVLVTGVLPLAAAWWARGYLGAARQPRPGVPQWYQLSLGGAALASVAVAWLVQAALDAAGAYQLAPLNGLSTLPVTQIPGVLYADAEAVLLLFGGDFLAQPKGLLTGMALVHLAGVSLAGCAVWIGARRWLREPDLVTAALVAAVFINGAAYVVLRSNADAFGANEIAAVLPFSAALAGRLLGTKLARPRPRSLTLLVFACYLACLGYAVAQPPVPAADQHLADWLAARHLRSGLAAYWQASGTTLASGGHIQVSPVCATKGRFIAEKWESKASWYDPRLREARFLILGEQAACNNATAAQARSAFGPPAGSYQVGPYTVLVWRRNLLSLVLDRNRAKDR